MLIINAHPIETIEDVLIIFEPDRVRLEKTIYFERNYLDPRGHRAWWLVNDVVFSPFIEINYYDGQKDDFDLWHRMARECEMKTLRSQSIDELVGLLWKWHSLNRPANEFTMGTKPPALLGASAIDLDTA